MPVTEPETDETTDRYADLEARLADRTARIGILGMGYVGLPLAMRVSGVGFPVLGLDPMEEKVRRLEAGESYVEDVSSEEVAAARGRDPAFEVTGDFARLADADVLVVCVPTPLSKTKEPDLRFLESAVTSIAAHLRRGQMVIVESTTYPGTTEELVLPILEGGGLRVGEDFLLAFSPERVDPNNVEWTIRTTPKVVGGMGERSRELAVAFYGSFVDTVVPVSSTKTAEMVKILENTFRAVNIGLINEIAIMCHKLDVDVWEVIEAAKTKPFGFMPFYPGPGLGGHCIPVDPLYLGWKLRTVNYRARFVELADHVNSTMPNYVVFRIAATLNKDAKAVRGSKVMLLGVSYKPGVSDVRQSPALAIVEQLVGLGAKVCYHDPHVPRLEFGSLTMPSADLSRERVRAQDLVVLTTAHPELDYGMVVEEAPRILDTRNGLAAFAGLETVERL